MFRISHRDLDRAQLLVGSKQNQKAHQDYVSDQIIVDGPLSDLCLFADVSKRELNHILLIVALCSILVLIVSLFTRALLLPATIIPSAFALFWLSNRSVRRSERFEKDYPAFLLSLASSVRTGLDPLSAMLESAKLFEPGSEIQKELLKFRRSIEHGDPETKSIGDFASSIRHPDIQLFRTGYLLSRREGSSLAECLQRLAKVTRQRQSFRRKIRSAVAMQRLSAFGIGGCAILICGIQSVGNPKIITDALANPVGQRLMIAGATLISLGLLWMIRMTRSSI